MRGMVRIWAGTAGSVGRSHCSRKGDIPVAGIRMVEGIGQEKLRGNQPGANGEMSSSWNEKKKRIQRAGSRFD